MPEDIPKTVAILIWLLVGVIIFGWILMSNTVLNSFLFVAVYFGVPIIIYRKINSGSADKND